MIGLGLGLSRLSSILGGVIKKGLQMWLGFAKGTVLSSNSINLESRFASTVVGIVSPVVVEGPREISFDDTHFEQFNQEMASVNAIYSQTYSSAYITAGTLVTFSGNVTQRDSTSTWNGLDVTRDGYLEFRLSTNTIVKVYIDAAHSVASDGLNIDATTGFFSVSLTLTEGATQFLISAYDIKADDESDPGVRISNLSLSSSSTDNVLGAELVENGDFEIASGASGGFWTAGSGWSISGNGLATRAATGTNYAVDRDSFLTINQIYKVIIEISVVTSGNVTVVLGATNSPTFTSSGTYTFIGVQTSNTKLRISPSSDYVGSVSNISVKEVAQFIPDKSINTNEAKLFTGKALEFNGNDSVDCGGVNSVSDYFTISAWVYLTTGGNHQAVFNTAESSNPYEGTDCYIRNSDGAIGSYADGFVYSSNKISKDVWSRVVWRFYKDTTNGTIDASINGGLFFNIFTGDTGSSNLLVNDGKVSIGSFRGGGNYFSGKLSDIQIYNAAWTSDDVAYDYANPNNLATDNPSTSLTLSNLLAYYALSEGSGNVIFDSTGLGAELVTNGDFSDGETGWNFTLPWSIVDNQATTPGTSDGVIQKIDQTSLVNGSNRLTFDIIEGEAQVYTNYPVFSSKGTFSTVGTHTIDLDSDGLDTGSSSNGKDNRLFFIYNKATNVSLTVDNVSVRLNKGDDGTGAFKNEASTPVVIGATWVDKQPTIPQLGMMDWSKGSNLIAFSDDVTGTGWSTPSDGDDGVDPVVTLNHGISPTGVKNAARVVFDIGSSTISADFSQLQYSITVEDEKDYNTSLYIKSNDSNDYTLAFLDIDGTRTNITANQSWQRYNVSGTAIDTSQFFKLRIRGSESTSKNANVLIYGPQITLGALGSYIATAGFPASNATLIQNPNDLGKDVLGNALRLRDGGFNLDGIGYADVADDASLDFGTGNFSIETWVNIQSSANGELISKIASNVGFKLNSTPGGTGEWLFQVNDGSSPHTYTYSNASFVGVGWCHISAVVDRSKNKIDLYFDSSLSNGNTGGQNLGDLGNVSNSTLLRIAKGANVADGLIDELRLYNRALTHKEIINNYKAGLSKHS